MFRAVEQMVQRNAVWIVIALCHQEGEPAAAVLGHRLPEPTPVSQHLQCGGVDVVMDARFCRCRCHLTVRRKRVGECDG